MYGKLMPAVDSLAMGGLPIGLAHGVVLNRPVAAGQPVRWSDVTAVSFKAWWPTDGIFQQ